MRNMDVSVAGIRSVGKSPLQAVVRLLRDAILRGEFAPDTKVRIEDLRARYGTSLGTVREALSCLLAEGLVVEEGQKGFRIASMSVADITDIMTTRSVLESHALTYSMQHTSVDWEAGVVASLHLLNRIERDSAAFGEWLAANRAFHLALCSGCPSPRLRDFLVSLFHQSQRYGHRLLSRGVVPRHLSDEHDQIVRAVLAGDVDLAVSCLKSHIEQVKGELVEIAALSPTPRDPPE